MFKIVESDNSRDNSIELSRSFLLLFFLFPSCSFQAERSCARGVLPERQLLRKGKGKKSATIQSN